MASVCEDKFVLDTHASTPWKAKGGAPRSLVEQPPVLRGQWLHREGTTREGGNTELTCAWARPTPQTRCGSCASRSPQIYAPSAESSTCAPWPARTLRAVCSSLGCCVTLPVRVCVRVRIGQGRGGESICAGSWEVGGKRRCRRRSLQSLAHAERTSADCAGSWMVWFTKGAPCCLSSQVTRVRAFLLR